MNEIMKTFKLTQAHINLFCNLNIKCCTIIHPELPFQIYIDAKRPFGNSYILADLMDMLGIKPKDVTADGEPIDGTEPYTKEDIRKAYQLITELPTAVNVIQCIIQKGRAIKPGTYLLSHTDQLRQEQNLYACEWSPLINEIICELTDRKLLILSPLTEIEDFEIEPYLLEPDAMPFVLKAAINNLTAGIETAKPKRNRQAEETLQVIQDILAKAGKEVTV